MCESHRTIFTTCEPLKTLLSQCLPQTQPRYTLHLVPSTSSISRLSKSGIDNEDVEMPRSATNIIAISRLKCWECNDNVAVDGTSHPLYITHVRFSACLSGQQPCIGISGRESCQSCYASASRVDLMAAEEPSTGIDLGGVLHYLASLANLTLPSCRLPRTLQSVV